jgi:hypothetical protein
VKAFAGRVAYSMGNVSAIQKGIDFSIVSTFAIGGNLLRVAQLRHVVDHAWKGHDWNSLERLIEIDMTYDPIGRPSQSY